MSCEPCCPLVMNVAGVVSVSNVQTQLLAANPDRKNAIIQNLDTSVLQVHFTNGQAFGAGPVQLAQYQSIELGQAAGVYQGIVYGIRAAATGNAGVIEEE